MNSRTSPAPRTLTIELLALDLDTCGRCTRTEASLDAALRAVSERLERQDLRVEVQKTVVTSAKQAERLRFASSPTIRVDGRDIALELRESDCGDCGELCGCDGGVACRVWVWQGREHLDAPQAMIEEAVLRAWREGPNRRPVESAPFRLPENLRRFFERRAAGERAAGGGAAATGCCAGPTAAASPSCGCAR